MAELKYKVLRREKIALRRLRGAQVVTVRRIVALRDIPRHGVKKGDIGGYINHKSCLSQEGDSWIGGDAIVYNDGWVIQNNIELKTFPLKNFGSDNLPELVSGDSIVTDSASLHGSSISDNVSVRGNVGLMYARLRGNIQVSGTTPNDPKVTSVSIDRSVIKQTDSNNSQGIISGSSIVIEKSKMIADFKINDEARINETYIDGTFVAKDFASIKGAATWGNVTIQDTAKIFSGAEVRGTSVISGTAIIPDNFKVSDFNISKGVATYEMANLQMGIETGKTVPSEDLEAIKVNDSFAKAIKVIKRIESKYESYIHDIVKLLKYPAMGDASTPEVRDFIVKLNRAKDAIEDNDLEKIAEHAQSLEEAFVTAESKVLILSQSHLDETKKKSLKTARKMFTIAEDEGATENERKVSFKAGFKELEGILPLPDEVISAFKVKTGLLEIEA